MTMNAATAISAPARRRDLPCMTKRAWPGARSGNESWHTSATGSFCHNEAVGGGRIFVEQNSRRISPVALGPCCVVAASPLGARGVGEGETPPTSRLTPPSRAELEALLLAHPAVADAAVIPIPDEEAGELPKALVALKPGHTATPDELIEHVDGQVAHYKRIRELELIDQIPKSPSGKILRRLLRDRERDRV